LNFKIAKKGQLFGRSQNEEHYVINTFQNSHLKEEEVSKEDWQKSLIEEETADLNKIRKTKQCFWFQNHEIIRAEFYYFTESEKKIQVYESFKNGYTIWEEDVSDNEKWIEGEAYHFQNETAVMKKMKEKGFQLLQKYIEYDRTYWTDQEITESSFRRYYLYNPEHKLEVVISNR